MEGDEGGDARGGLDASEVEDGLWVGGHPAPGQVTEDDFDVLVLLARGNQQDGLAGVGVDVARASPALEDEPGDMPEGQAEEAIRAGRWVARQVKAGRRVLVTCEEGLNRGPLVAALALMNLDGVDWEDAVGRLRTVRGEHALNNPAFLSLLQRYVRG